MGRKKAQKTKEPKVVATLEQRQKLAKEIRAYLAMHNLPETLWPIEELLRIVDAYVESGEGASGRIPIPEIDRVIVYMLSTRPDPNDVSKARGEVGILYTGQEKA